MISLADQAERDGVDVETIEKLRTRIREGYEKVSDKQKLKSEERLSRK